MKATEIELLRLVLVVMADTDLLTMKLERDVLIYSRMSKRSQRSSPDLSIQMKHVVSAVIPCAKMTT